jgi:hypothetical protein
MRFAIGLFLAFVAGVSLFALSEHVAPLFGAEWLKNILPFALASQPSWLAGISIAAAIGAWLLLRRSREE